MNATQTIFDLQMDNACDYLMKAEDILRFPAINRGPLVNASKTATACKPLVLPSLVHLFQVSAEEKKDKLFLPRTTWQFISPLDPKQETIQPSKPKGKPTNNQSAYYRKIWAFRQECMKQEAPASGTRSQPKDDTGPILFVNTGPPVSCTPVGKPISFCSKQIDCWWAFPLDTDRATQFHRTLLDEQKAQQAQERNQLQRAQRTEAKARLAHFKTELKKLGLSGPEHRHRLTVVGRGGQAAGGEAKFAAVAGGPAEGGAGAV
ncbi:hypothetical protein DPEC_G00369900 [Dallia pectoralis]|nr:hypothetical protein DPEC_G00369900 [Dallia pectoralis]